MAEPVLDLNNRVWVHRAEGLTAVGTWANIDGRWRPCMAIYRTSDENRRDLKRPCVVNLDNAWIWDEQHGNPALAGDIMGMFLVALRLDPIDYPKVLNLIRSRLQDLIEMPPYPSELRRRDLMNGVAHV